MIILYTGCNDGIGNCLLRGNRGVRSLSGSEVLIADGISHFSGVRLLGLGTVDP